MDCLAYFISFHTYGSRLHGSDELSVDRQHNGYDTPTLPPKPDLEQYCREAMTQPPYTLDAARREVVLTAVVQHAGFRGWTLHAAHVRTNHVHVVVTSAKTIERTMDEFKAYASRALGQLDPPDRKRWVRHGSTRYLWDERSLTGAITYTLDEQGERMAWHAAEAGR